MLSGMESAAALIAQARAARIAGELDIAIAAQTSAVGLLGAGPARDHAQRHLADMLSEAGRPAEAEPHYRAVLAAAEADPLDAANAWRGAALNATRLPDRALAIQRWRVARDRYAALDARLRTMTGAPDNPGVAEAEAQLGALGAH